MSALTEQRQYKDRLFGGSRQSPLTREQQKNFKGLKYFDENPALRFTVKIEKYPHPERVIMHTSTGHGAEFFKYGVVRFTVNGQPQTLHLYQSAEHDSLFLPFMDETTGHETYGSGRYLDAQERDDDTLELDFNLSYNPYCAYNEQWTCPIPPRENRLTVRIEAGERKFHDD